MRSLLAAIVTLAGLAEAAAQSPLSLSSQIESGWTSNATDSPGGVADAYRRHSHDLSFTGTMGPLALRAGFLLEQTSFRVHDGEDDLSVTGGLEAGLTLAEGMSLRLGYAVTHSWTGEMVELGPAVLTLRSLAVDHEMLGELVLAGADRAVTVGFDARRRQPGLTLFDGLPLPPLRLGPEVAQVTARIDGEWVITPELAGLARLYWFLTRIPDADRADYGREPANGARLASGLRLRQGIFTAEARAGFDLVWPEAAPHLLRQLPHLDASTELALTEQLTLSGRVLAGVELFDPIDSVAGRKLEAELAARLALTERIALSAGLAFSREHGLYDDSLQTTRHSLHGGVVFASSPGVEARLKASHAEVEEPGGAYPVSTISLTLGGRV